VNITEVKPLTPLTHGVVLLVGVKASNLDVEIRTHPRIIMWESLRENWTNRDIPNNTRAIFMTRFISHAIFDKIVAEARKRHITIFNCMGGTGILKRQVRELLELRKGESIPEVFSTPVHAHSAPVVVSSPTPVVTTPTIVTTTTPPKVTMAAQQGKLKPLYDMIDYSGTRTNADMARDMFAKAQELGIDTTLLSLIQLVNYKVRNYKKSLTTPTVRAQMVEKSKTQDKTNIVVQMLDNMVRELKDMRDYVKATEEENRTLKLRVEKLKKALSDD